MSGLVFLWTCFAVGLIGLAFVFRRFSDAYHDRYQELWGQYIAATAEIHHQEQTITALRREVGTAANELKVLRRMVLGEAWAKEVPGQSEISQSDVVDGTITMEEEIRYGARGMRRLTASLSVDRVTNDMLQSGRANWDGMSWIVVDVAKRWGDRSILADLRLEAYASSDLTS